MKNRTLYPENITKSFRKFNGNLSIQIDDKQWVELPPSDEVDKFIRARNMGKLESVTINDNKEIVDIKLKNKNSDKKEKILSEVKKLYRHG